MAGSGRVTKKVTLEISKNVHTEGKAAKTEINKVITKGETTTTVKCHHDKATQSEPRTQYCQIRDWSRHLRSSYNQVRTETPVYTLRGKLVKREDLCTNQKRFAEFAPLYFFSIVARLRVNLEPACPPAQAPDASCGQLAAKKKEETDTNGEYRTLCDADNKKAMKICKDKKARIDALPAEIKKIEDDIKTRKVTCTNEGVTCDHWMKAARYKIALGLLAMVDGYDAIQMNQAAWERTVGKRNNPCPIKIPTTLIQSVVQFLKDERLIEVAEKK